jgi:hypothetical protein
MDSHADLSVGGGPPNRIIRYSKPVDSRAELSICRGSPGWFIRSRKPLEILWTAMLTCL